jgi:hypothetical protein
MKAEAGSWFYIILSIAFIIISALGKNKKKVTASPQPLNEPAPSHKEEKKWPKTLEEILSEVLDVPKSQEVIIAKEEIPVITQKAENSSNKNYEQEVPKHEISIPEKKTTTTKPETNSEPKLKPNEIPVTVKFERDFDLREGIIYAEILNRKYF